MSIQNNSLSKKNGTIYSIISIYILLLNAFLLFMFFQNISIFHINWLLNWKFLISYVPDLFALIAAAIFLISRFKINRPIQIYFCYTIFCFPFYLLSIYWRFHQISMNGDVIYTWNNLIFSITVTVFLLVGCITGLWLLTKKQKPFFIYNELGGETFAEFVPVSASVRFVNRLIDVTIVFSILMINIHTNFFFRENFEGTGRMYLIIIETVTSIGYYILIEGIFKITIGKCITNTMVINEAGDRPSFVNMIGRTFCRLIPLEGFSFLGSNARGLHDSLSGTYVVKKSS